MSMKLVLYQFPPSPQVRAVKILGEALNLKFDLKFVNSSKEEHLSEEFFKINPTLTLPTLDDNGTIVWNSHTIMKYLVDKYGKNDEFYPKNLRKREEVNQLLSFDALFYIKLVALLKPIFTFGVQEVPKDLIEDMEGYYAFLEKLLEGKVFFAGTNVTIADISLATTASASNTIIQIYLKYPNLTRWLRKIEQLPYYKSNADSIEEYLNNIN